MRSDKKVIILDNIKSDCIEQAMFILKDSRPENIDAVREAEKIVENYTKRYHYTLYSKMLKKRRLSGAILTGIVLGCAVFLGVACALYVI
ncbi:MAG: hypothetical protein IJD97_04085 [Clostridia bacterium]|nr:hypothetical protein [Clostridia bacterium]